MGMGRKGQELVLPSDCTTVDTSHHIAIAAEKGSGGSDRTSATLLQQLVQIATAPPPHWQQHFRLHLQMPLVSLLKTRVACIYLCIRRAIGFYGETKNGQQ